MYCAPVIFITLIIAVMKFGLMAESTALNFFGGVSVSYAFYFSANYHISCDTQYKYTIRRNHYSSILAVANYTFVKSTLFATPTNKTQNIAPQKEQYCAFCWWGVAN
jgi:hypothetical protein